MEYNFTEIEKKWQRYWQEKKIFKTPEKPLKKFYVLEMYPYPSGEPHMGHLRNYVVGDVVARIKRMEGYDILHPMGWDAFGLPAENAAIQRGINPREWTTKNIKAYKDTFRMLGISYDWEREIATCSPDYYKWTQWIFLLLYKKGLAYRKREYVNWCPSCNTVLANEQVVDGRCERCKTLVVKKALKQWFFKITDYAERLLKDLEKLKGKWPERIIKLQENWIGKSEGTEIVFIFEDHKTRLPVFTTRADTLFGVTFITIAPEHPLVERIINNSPYKNEIEKYIQQALKKPDVERIAEEKEKSGVFTGMYAYHPFTQERVPVWIGDYVLASYGTGIVMGVPAHDQRDFLFAKKYNLPVKIVIKPFQEEIEVNTLARAFEDYGIMINSGEFSGLGSQEGIKKIQEKLEEKGLGGKSVSYRIRDWLVSRQRYWGAPIPMIHCSSCGVVPVPEEELPVLLPENIKDFLPKGRSPLEDVLEFINTKCPRCKKDARRDPDTMDTFVDSSWYFLRFTDPKNSREPFSFKNAKTWMPVDQYIGGAEHATKHLIYARFINKVLYDEGFVLHDEPFIYLFNQGLVHKKFFWCPKCLKVVEDIEERRHKECKTPVEERLEMMSSSRGNVVPVAPFVKENGADVARVTILFAGPAEKDMEWTDAGVEGAKRFLQRVWRLYSEVKDKIRKIEKIEEIEKLSNEEKKLYQKFNKTLKAVIEDSKEFHFNTALARLMELLSEMQTFKAKDSLLFSYVARGYLIMLAPFAPHLAEELWEKIKEKDSIFKKCFPPIDKKALIEEKVTIVIQVNGKVRGRIEVEKDSPEEEIFKKAVQEENVKKFIKNKKIIKKIYIKNKLFNLVVQ